MEEYINGLDSDIRKLGDWMPVETSGDDVVYVLKGSSKRSLRILVAEDLFSIEMQDEGNPRPKVPPKEVKDLYDKWYMAYSSSLEGLVNQITDENIHKEVSTGNAVGEEVIDDKYELTLKFYALFGYLSRVDPNNVEFPTPMSNKELNFYWLGHTFTLNWDTGFTTTCELKQYPEMDYIYNG